MQFHSHRCQPRECHLLRISFPYPHPRSRPREVRSSPTSRRPRNGTIRGCITSTSSNVIGVAISGLPCSCSFLKTAHTLEALSAGIRMGPLALVPQRHLRTESEPIGAPVPLELCKGDLAVPWHHLWSSLLNGDLCRLLQLLRRPRLQLLLFVEA